MFRGALLHVSTACTLLLSACTAYDRPVGSVPPPAVRGAIVSGPKGTLTAIIPDGWRRYLTSDRHGRRLSIENAEFGASIAVETVETEDGTYALAEAMRVSMLRQGFTCQPIGAGNREQLTFAEFTCRRQHQGFRVSVLRPFSTGSGAQTDDRRSPPAVMLMGRWPLRMHDYCGSAFDGLLNSIERK